MISRSTVNIELRHVKAFLRWCVRRKWLREDPTLGLEFLSTPRRDCERAVLPEEAERILKKLDVCGHDGTRCRCRTVAEIARLVANTGLRLGEALYLRARDVDLAGGRIYVRNQVDHPLKDLDDRMVPLNEPAARVLARRMPPGTSPDALLFSTSSGKAFDRANIAKWFKTAAVLAGVPKAHFYALLDAFRDERYLTVNGKPLFYIFKPKHLPDVRRVTEPL